MFNLRHKLAKLQNSLFHLYKFERDVEIQKLLAAKLLSETHSKQYGVFKENIQAAEFRVSSQWNDDGIIQFLINYLDIEAKTFVEFGVEDYRESITRFLLQNNNWKGFVMDGSKKNIRLLRAQDIYWRHDLTAVAAWITADNINSLLERNAFTGEIGLLHIDVDGPDYWIWKAIDCITPVIVIVEYDHLLQPNQSFVPLQQETKFRTGSSLLSLCDLAEAKGYAFIGCESHGVNAYFVRKDKLKELKPLSCAQGYVQASVRDIEKKRSAIKDHPVFNTRTQREERFP
jgi:hypothetical protein